MAQLRLRVKLNKGRRGIPLDKLEKFVAETRRFLLQAGDDLGISEPNLWVGVDFENGSLAFTNEAAVSVAPEKVSRFNECIMALGRSEYPGFLQESTSNQFFKITSVLDQYESADLAIFDEQGEPTWVEISRTTAALAKQQNVLPYRTSEGAVQGIIHTLHKEAREPYFTLRELSSWELIKCFYKAPDYAAIVRALEVRDQIVHVRGAVVTDTHQRSIDHITVTRILVAEPYTYDDVERFLGTSWPQ